MLKSPEFLALLVIVCVVVGFVYFGQLAVSLFDTPTASVSSAPQKR